MIDMNDDLLSLLSIDPRLCFGQPCTQGHGIWVFLILGLRIKKSPVGLEAERDSRGEGGDRSLGGIN